MSFRSLRYVVPIVATAGFLMPWGCSATTEENAFTTGSGTTTTTVGPTGSGGAGGMGGSSTESTGALNIGGNNQGQGGSNLDPDAACASSSATVELQPLDIIVLLDRSGSMSGSRWTGAVQALTTFINDPASTGISVGLLYFPAVNLNGLDDCDKTLYDDLIVPIGELPMNAPALVSSLNMTSPGGLTPMYGAIEGTLFAATAYQDANPTHKVIVVFASDGDPGGCSAAQDQIPAIAQLCASALNYNGVQTYVIAMQGATVSNLNQLAAAGGTGQAYDVTADIALFSEKMAEIRANELSCEFPLPDPPEGEELDINKVSIKFTDGSGMQVEIPRATDLNDCGIGAGWYYDNNLTPTKIQLCPFSCSTVQDELSAELGVFFGCEPDVN
ncbi:MAG TPA: vWA domain-containing protein [Candidatus Nanopelagicales bacterium]|nr:vWA domain-containing protein [Candidatus Nanopelagicales bacterium]